MSELLEPGQERRDIRLFEKAMERGSHISPQVWDHVIKRLHHIAVKGSDELAIRATIALLKVAEYNHRLDSPAQAEVHNHVHAVIPATTETALDALKRSGLERLARLGQE